MSDREEISEMLESVLEEGRNVLTEYESKRVLSNWDINVAETRLVTDKLDAVDAARELKYPVVMKICSPDIRSKKEIGCVRTGLSSEIEVRQAYDDIISEAKMYDENADIHGVIVQEYVPDAKEVVMGVIRDRSFGPTVKFGLGGIWLEILEDVSYKLAPVSEEEAEDMIEEIDGYPVLSGVEGDNPVNFDSLVDIIKKMSEIPIEYGLISEVDLDPVFSSEKEAIVIDAEMTLKEMA